LIPDDNSATVAVVVVDDDAVGNIWKSSSPEIPRSTAAVDDHVGFAAGADADRNAHILGKTDFPLETCWISLKLDFHHVECDYQDDASVGLETDHVTVDFGDFANVAADVDDGSFDFGFVELFENEPATGTATIDGSADVAGGADAASAAVVVVVPWQC